MARGMTKENVTIHSAGIRTSLIRNCTDIVSRKQKSTKQTINLLTIATVKDWL